MLGSVVIGYRIVYVFDVMGGWIWMVDFENWLLLTHIFRGNMEVCSNG